MDEKLQKAKLDMIFALWDMKDAIWKPEDPNPEVIGQKYEPALDRFMDARNRALDLSDNPFPKFFKLSESLPDQICAMIQSYHSQNYPP